MRGLLRLLPIALAVALSGLSPAAAQTPADIVVLPFTPPLDHELRYRVSRRVIGVPVPATDVTLRLKFEAGASGYLMTLDTDSVEQQGVTFTHATGPVQIVGRRVVMLTNLEDMVALQGPFAFELREDGLVERLHEWEPLKARIRTIPDEVIASLPPGRPREQIRPAIVGAVARLTSLSAEGAQSYLGKDWPSLLGLGGKTFVISEKQIAEGSFDLLGNGKPIRSTTTGLLTRRPDGGLTLTFEQVLDQDELLSALEQFDTQTANDVPPEIAPLLAADRARLKTARRTSTSVINFDSGGLVESGSWEVRMQEGDQVVVSTKVSVERLP